MFSFSPSLEQRITALRIKAMLKRAAPNSEPNGINAVVAELLVPATMAVMISGAPLARARKVIPASASDIS